MSIPEESVRAVFRALTVESLSPVSTERLLDALAPAVASLADPYPVLRLTVATSSKRGLAAIDGACWSCAILP